MQKLTYPLLYFQLKENVVLGILVGTGMEIVEKDLKTVKSTLLSYIQKQYKKYGDYPFMDMIEPRLKIVEIPIRPTYKEKTGSYPATHTLRVPIPVIYGETDKGFFECYLPLFNESFFYYDIKQFNSLVLHFATNQLNNKKPEQIHKYLLYQKPQLDSISLKVNTERNFDWGTFTFERSFKTLERLAEKYPPAKALRKNLNAFPDAAWEMEDKVSEVIEKMVTLRANILLVGNRGVGKSAVLRQAIKKVSSNANKQQKLDFTFWQVMAQRITATSKYLGEWQETVEKLIEELVSNNGILWIVDIIRLLQMGGQGPEDSVASFMTSFLQQGKLQLVGEVTPQELESMRRLLPGFTENFQLVIIDELPEKKAQNIIQKFSHYSAQNLKIEISDAAQQLAYRLLARYYPYESFPGKAVKFLGQNISEAKLQKKHYIDKTDVIDNFIKQTGLPELFLRDDLLLDIKELEDFFNENIIGQPDAVDNMTGIVKIYKAGLNNPYKPITTLLFAGPTGVGKTASAKRLANYFFGKGQKRSPLIRIDMSEFQHPAQLGRFIGAGNEVGQLVKDIRERPFAVLLLDEVEKADPSIFDALLTVLDEGMLVDNFGRITNFRNTIIIMTTNLGASNRKSMGFGNNTSDKANYLSAVSKYFRPEFVNRIDGIVMFNALNKDDIKTITIKELEDLKNREGLTKRGLKLKFTDSLIQHLSTIGFDARYGARPLQKAIEETVVKPMASWLLKHPNVKNTSIRINYQKKVLITTI